MNKQQLEQVLEALLEANNYTDDEGVSPLLNDTTITAIETIKQAIADYDKPDGAVGVVRVFNAGGSGEFRVIEGMGSLQDNTKLYLRPETKRVPMTTGEIVDAELKFLSGTTSTGMVDFRFIAGIKASEKHHGVTE